MKGKRSDGEFDDDGKQFVPAKLRLGQARRLPRSIGAQYFWTWPRAAEAAEASVARRREKAKRISGAP